MNDKSLPQPVRPLPFLDTSERKIVQGGTPESQYEFAAGVFDRLIHCSGDITLLRAEQDGSAQLSPSPFWPEGEIKESIDIWNKPNRAWLRADWLRIAHGEAMSSSKENNAGDSEGKSYIPEALPGGLSASSMERAIVCPYRFFADTVLKIEPMERIRSFVSPAERGTRMHRILASFTKEMRKKNLDPSEDEDKIRRLLTKCAEEVLKDALHCPYWEIERRLWIGSDSPSEGGLLLAWLGEEINRSKDGWRCVAEEVFFDNLKCENWPFSLHGRIDRIDCHKTGAVACLDYKTGRAPSSSDVTTRMIAPQLPIYLLALREKKIPDMEKYVDVQNGVSAGYIHLKSQKDVRIYDIKDIDLSLDKWVDKISEMGRILAAGDFPAIPYPVSDYKRKEDACRDCEFITLCEKGLQQEITLSEEGNDDGRSY
jgi:RecB family exonuclease